VRCGAAALNHAVDPTAVIAPLAAAFLRHQRGAQLLTLLDHAALPPETALLLRGKALLAARRPAEACAALESACGVPEALHEARHLLPVALWEAGRRADADAALAALLPTALYPFRVHARRAEWAWQQGDRPSALGHLEAALASAPPHRHGRLLHRRAAWKEALGDAVGARADRLLAAERDPTYRGAR
jgi:hypothetical protein